MNGTGPNFFIIGAPKCATTSLCTLLNSHPQAGIAQGKEPNFFSYQAKYNMGWQAYLTLFNHCLGKKAVGDGSTSYSRLRSHPATVDRIKNHVPEAKIIYMVRHPLQRMESAYVEHLCTIQGHVFSSVNEAVRTQAMIINSGRYWEVFDAYRKKFNESKIKIVWFEEYIANQTAVFQDVCRFLEISDSVIPDFTRERTNSREKAPAVMAKRGLNTFQVNTNWDEETKKWAIDQIREDNCRFLEHFGRPKNFWGDLF